MNKITIIYWITIAGLLICGIDALLTHQSYIFDAIFFTIVLTYLYLKRSKFLLSYWGTLCICIGIMINTTGVFGTYNLNFGGIGIDKFLHIISSAGIALLIYTYLATRKIKGTPTLTTRQIATITILVVIGIGNIAKLSEFVGQRYFGQNTGILGESDGTNAPVNDFSAYDPYWDMISNVFGALLGTLWAGLLLHKHKKIIIHHTI